MVKRLKPKKKIYAREKREKKNIHTFRPPISENRFNDSQFS